MRNIFVIELPELDFEKVKQIKERVQEIVGSDWAVIVITSGNTAFHFSTNPVSQKTIDEIKAIIDKP